MITITLEGKEYQFDIEQAKELGLLKEKDSREIIKLVISPYYPYNI